MQQTLFYIAKGGKQDGPFSLEIIVEQVKNKTLDISDYLYDEVKQDWVMLMAHADLAEKLKTQKPYVAPGSNVVQAKKEVPSTSEWYVLKDSNKFGPFGHREVVKMLQEKSLREYDYVWHSKLANWERVANVPDFSPEAIQLLKDSGMTGLNEVFFRRRHARVAYGASMLIHDNKRVYKGKSLEVSGGGAGIAVENGDWKKGDSVFMHFKPGDGVPPFNATCEIVTKKAPESHEKSGWYQYGVKFTKIESNTLETINEYTSKNAA